MKIPPSYVVCQDAGRMPLHHICNIMAGLEILYELPCEYNGCHVCLLQESLTRCPTCGNTGGMSISSTCRCGLYVRRCFNIITRFTIRTECADEIMNTVEDVI